MLGLIIYRKLLCRSLIVHLRQKFPFEWNNWIKRKLHTDKGGVSLELLEFMKSLNSERDVLY